MNLTRDSVTQWLRCSLRDLVACVHIPPCSATYGWGEPRARFYDLQNGYNDHTDLIGWLRILNEFIHVKHLEQRLAHRKCSLHAGNYDLLEFISTGRQDRKEKGALS